MRRIVGKICTILIIILIIFEQIPKKPKLISSITTIDTSYLTILADKAQFENDQMMEKRILEMCREDSFNNMKLNTEDRQLSENLYISVYLNQRDLENGKPYLIIQGELK